MSNEFDRFSRWKLLVYADRIEQILDGEMPYPVNWHVYPSNACPYDCEYCIMGDEREQNDGAMLSNESLDKLVDDAAEIGIKLVQFTGGGEPLTHPYLNTTIGRLHDNGIKVALSTNGYLLSGLEEPVDHLRVSFDAGTPETYNVVHGVNAFERVVNNIAEAVEVGKGKDIGMGFVVTQDNFQEVEAFVRLAEDLGVDFVHIRPAYWPINNDGIRESYNSLSVPESGVVDIFATSKKFEGYWTNNKYPCRATPLHAVLTATEEFILCLDRLDLRWGDYRDQSFSEIWFNKRHKELIEEAQEGCDIRCVQCSENEVIERVFVQNELRMELI